MTISGQDLKLNRQLNLNVPQYQGSLQHNTQQSFSAQELPQMLPDTFENSQKEKAEKKKSIKRKILAVGMTLATIVGLATIGNKSSNKMAELGQKVDDLIVNKEWYKKACNGWSTLKTKVKDWFLNNKNDFIRNTSNDFAETYTKRNAHGKLDITRGYGKGFSSIFALTPVETLRTALTKVKEKSGENAAKEALKKLVGADKVDNMFEALMGKGGIKDNIQFCNEFTEALARNFNLTDAAGKVDKKKLLGVFTEMQKGKIGSTDVSEFTGLVMDKGGFIGNWSSTNFIDKIGGKIAKWRGKEWTGFCRGNLGDSLVKYNAVKGNLAETGLGSFVQKCVTVPTESISNFVNDKSNMGIALGLSVYSLYNNASKAPKEKRKATVASEFMSQMGSIALVTPLAFATTYKLASLGNLEGKTWLTKLLKWPGKIFNLGLNKYKLDGSVIAEVEKTGFLSQMGSKIKNGSGHLLRFFLIMFGFTALFQKPVQKLIHKVFGEPYDASKEEAKKKQQLAQEEQLRQMQALQLEQQYQEYLQQQAMQKQQQQAMQKQQQQFFTHPTNAEITAQAKLNQRNALALERQVAKNIHR